MVSTPACTTLRGDILTIVELDEEVESSTFLDLTWLGSRIGWSPAVSDLSDNGHRELFCTVLLPLNAIPDPTGCCNCGGEMQREFLEYVADGTSVTVVAEHTPGYGCRGCSRKSFHPPLVIGLLRGFAARLRESSNLEDAQGLEKEIEELLSSVRNGRKSRSQLGA